MSKYSIQNDPEIQQWMERSLESQKVENKVMIKEQIIDEAYEKYLKWANEHSKTYLYEPYTKEQFINKCKTHSEFSQKWGLKIEERELSLEERAKWLQDNKGYDLLVGNLEHDHIMEVVEDEAPTRLITITYNKTIESYE